jgi:ubiquinone biosynthesis monooxygenase Coq7
MSTDVSTDFRRAHPGDRLIGLLDQALRVVFAPAAAGRATGRATPRPAAATAPAVPLTPDETRHAAGLMRVNHAGEVAAQALYYGQALVARDEATREHLLHAAREEGDHLTWCAERLEQLDSRPSLLSPLWFAGAAAIGTGAALISDRISLGFVAETERQVETHLDEHLERLPEADAPSRAILEQMREDEIRHGRDARERGGVELPRPIKAAMRLVSRVMTTTAYRF